VTLRLGDFVPGIPEGSRGSFFDADRLVEVPCAEIFGGPVPKISLTTLAGLAPDCFPVKSFPDTQVRVPAARLALSYRLVTWSELIEEPVEVEPEPLADFPVMEAPPPAEAINPAADSTEKFSAPAAPASHQTPPPEPGHPPVDEIPEVRPSPPNEPTVPAPVKAITAPEPREPAKPPVESRAATPPPAKKPFSILPIFRRKEPEVPAPTPTEPRARVEIPKPKMPVSHLVPPPPPSPVEEIAGPVEPTGSLPEAAIPVEVEPTITPRPETSTAPVEVLPEPEELPAAARSPEAAAVWIETEHLPRYGVISRSDIANQDALQSVFMTEELLSVDRVIELCGALPGIKSCVLSHRDTVLTSHNVPDNIDLVSLSAHAVDMLAAMRESSAKMGIGAVPAVTVHSDKGPITFFNQEDLCLLVLHKDRGFVPGVREKLQTVVEQLSHARLPLPVSKTRHALEG
jgi:predicted regulator of Ras-like GTPase activity (Roadblock/LC7/MglB family)